MNSISRPAGASRCSRHCVGSIASMLSVGSIVSIASAGSIACVASVGSIGSIGSIASFGKVGAILNIPVLENLVALLLSRRCVQAEDSGGGMAVVPSAHVWQKGRTIDHYKGLVRINPEVAMR